MIVLASIPRCGSTYLLRSIAGLRQGGSTPEGVQKAHDIVKTHHVPAEEPRLEGLDLFGDDAAVFLWGDIYRAVESTRLRRMDPEHFSNCGASWPPEADIRDRDILGYGRLWEAWRTASFPVLWIRYRSLQEPRTRQLIEGWTGRTIQWLPWRERSTTVDRETRRKIGRAYAPLIEAARVEPDVFVRGEPQRAA